MSADLSLLVAAVLARAWRRDSAVHGEDHWRCVAATGLDLAPAVPGSDPVVAFAFGLLHDVRRENDSYDPEHGRRAAAVVRELHGEGVLLLDPARLEALAQACALHADGLVAETSAVGVCWDADRLHLPRVRIEVDPALLSTDAARDGSAGARAASHRDAPPSWSELVERASRLPSPLGHALQ